MFNINLRDEINSKKLLCLHLKSNFSNNNHTIMTEIIKQTIILINQRSIRKNRQFERMGSIERMISLMFRPADDEDKVALKSVSMRSWKFSTKPSPTSTSRRASTLK